MPDTPDPRPRPLHIQQPHIPADRYKDQPRRRTPTVDPLALAVHKARAAAATGLLAAQRELVRAWGHAEGEPADEKAALAHFHQRTGEVMATVAKVAHEAGADAVTVLDAADAARTVAEDVAVKTAKDKALPLPDAGHDNWDVAAATLFATSTAAKEHPPTATHSTNSEAGTRMVTQVVEANASRSVAECVISNFNPATVATAVATHRAVDTAVTTQAQALYGSRRSLSVGPALVEGTRFHRHQRITPSDIFHEIKRLDTAVGLTTNDIGGAQREVRIAKMKNAQHGYGQ